MDENNLTHTRWECKYHIVFAVKFRRKEICGKIKADIGVILRELCKHKEVEILEANACPDHVHKLVIYTPPLKKENDENVYAQRQRANGFETTAKELKADYLIATEYKEVQCYIKSAQDRKIGIVCSSDCFAIKLLSHIKNVDSVGIIGFDNISILDECDIALDSVQYDNKGIAINAFDAVIHHLPIDKYAKYSLIKRNSILKD